MVVVVRDRTRMEKGQDKDGTSTGQDDGMGQGWEGHGARQFI